MYNFITVSFLIEINHVLTSEVIGSFAIAN